MNRRTRCLEFPGGVLEVWDYRDTDDEDDGNPGVYLEWRGSEPPATSRSGVHDAGAA